MLSAAAIPGGWLWTDSKYLKDFFEYFNAAYNYKKFPKIIEIIDQDNCIIEYIKDSKSFKLNISLSYLIPIDYLLYNKISSDYKFKK